MNRMDSMLSHGLGKMKRAKARLTGLVGVFRTLAEQHGEITVLLERAKSSDDRFAELWPTIRRELLSHERAEVQELYPLLRAHPEVRGLADHHDTEAAELEQMIANVQELAIGSTGRRELYKQLVDTVLHHAREEEHEIFPKAQEVIGKNMAEALEPQFLQCKHRLMDLI